MNENVLIIDDDRQISQCASIRLRTAGYQTQIRHDGAEGFAAARANQPDAIVLDVRMPLRNGLDTLHDLQSEECTKHIPVIMLSASIVDEEAALDGGARYFIRKPFVGKALVDAVKAVTRTDHFSSC